MHTPIRLSTDQLSRTRRAFGAPPWAWPRDELVIDLLHKGGYSVTTGAFADALVSPLPTSSVGRAFPARRLKRFA